MIIGFLIYSMGGGGAERTVSLLSEKFCRQGCSVVIYVLEGANRPIHWHLVFVLKSARYQRKKSGQTGF